MLITREERITHDLHPHINDRHIAFGNADYLADMTEDDVKKVVLLKASKLGWRLWRNNVGVLVNDRGVPIRFGLANTSKAVNGELKSGDLIGIRPVLITPDMVGKVIGQFVSRECKESHWKYNPRDTRDVAQGRWAALVNSLGGDAKVTVGDL